MPSLRSPLVVPIVVVGIAGGLIGAAYLGVLHILTTWLDPGNRSVIADLVVLAGTGLVVVIGERVLGRSGGVDLLIDNIHVGGGAGGREARSVIPISLLCVAAGSTLGPEAPLVQTTGNFGDAVGARFGLSAEDRRVVAIAGMAAGFTVLFGAPVGGALFALEILHRRGLEYYEALLPALVGSLCGFAVFSAITHVGLDRIWHVPFTGPLTTADLAWGAAAGAVGAVLARLFAATVRATRAGAARLPGWAPPVAAGLVLAGLAAISPFALTNGEAQLDSLLATAGVGTLVLVAAVKMVGSAVAMAGRWKGGFIIPLFVAGFCLGTAAAPYLPSARPAVLGAALAVGLCAAVTRTPLGSTLVITEMTGLAILPATLAAAVVAVVLARDVQVVESQRRRPDRHPPETRPDAQSESVA